MEGGAFFTAAPMELATEIGWNVDQSDASIAHYKEPFKLQQNIDQVALESQTIQNDDSSEHKKASHPSEGLAMGGFRNVLNPV